jgi:hypothetical protein
MMEDEKGQKIASRRPNKLGKLKNTLQANLIKLDQHWNLSPEDKFSPNVVYHFNRTTFLKHKLSFLEFSFH